MVLRSGILLVALLSLSGCQAALAIAAIQASTFGEPTMVGEYKGNLAAFAECLEEGFTGTVDTTGKDAHGKTITKPDVGSYEFYVKITPLNKKTLRVTTWVAGWAQDSGAQLKERYKTCDGATPKSKSSPGGGNVEPNTILSPGDS